MAGIDPKDETIVMIAAPNLAAATLAATQVLLASSNSLSAALLDAPNHSAHANTAELAATGKTVEVILGNGETGPSNKEMKKIVRLLRRLLRENPGAPVVT
jgi:hypothetical protein